MTEATEQLVTLIERFGIGYVVFNDHLDEGLRMAREIPHAFALWAARTGRSAAEFETILHNRKALMHQVPRHLCALADAFDRLGVIYGSHDDCDAATREGYRMLGARVCEFPTTREAAAAAKVMDCPVLLGAPNVVRGCSQAGNIAAQDLIAEGLCDALVSDYHLPSLAAAAWHLVDQGLAELPRAWAMISTAPASILGLRDRGRIAPGLRADLVAVNRRTREIELTISGGAVAYASGEAVSRLMAAGAAQDRIAAE
jgi:alpha-D-ribose 1-methylphosphonate 5-triphosphate diphosphatase